MKTEEPFFDEDGREIQEFSVIQVYHFTGVRRKKHYMYKWVRLAADPNGNKYWYGIHLTEPISEDKLYKNGYWLRSCADENRRIKGTKIVQQYE